MAEKEYVFSADSEIWKINRYWTGLIYGPAAVLLQVAHPRVAQGVAEHSDFQKDTFGRLTRTLSSVNRIAFGTVEQAEEMRKRLASVHGGVRGETADGVPGPSKYSAFEPDLLLWVLATLIDASIQGHELIRGAIDPERREGFYRDMRMFGSFFGLDESYGPANYAEFERYYSEMLADETMGGHALCGTVAEAVVYPRAPFAARLLGPCVNFLPIETIPARIRDQLRLKSTWWTRFRMAAFRKVAPIVFRLTPRRFRYYPEARLALEG